MSNKCKLIALDTSIQKTGFSVFEDGVYKKSGVLKQDRKVSGDEALYCESKKILDFLKAESPDIVVIETTQQRNNYQVYRRLSMLTGVVFGYTVSNDAHFESFEAKKWRSIIDSAFAKMKREDAKQWGIEYVKNRYGITVETDDESDAVLIGQAQINLIVEEDNGL